MNYIIPSIIALIFGIVFLICGIYQITRHRVLVKDINSRNDSPFETGLLFVYLGLLGLVLAFNLFCQIPEVNCPESLRKSAAVACFTVGMIGPVMLIVAGIIGLIRKRIITVRINKYTRDCVRKYYVPTNIVSILSGIAVPAAILSTFFTPGNKAIVGSLFAIAALLVVIMCILISIVEHGSKPTHKAKTTKAPTKPTRATKIARAKK